MKTPEISTAWPGDKDRQTYEPDLYFLTNMSWTAYYARVKNLFCDYLQSSHMCNSQSSRILQKSALLNVQRADLL